MRTFLQNKLWRTKFVDILEKEHGSQVKWRYLNDTEFDKQLRIKLLEETKKIIAAKTKKELTEELADLFEIIDSLLEIHKITKEKIFAIKKKKKIERGDFLGRRFVESVKHPRNSLSEQYFLAQPDKYPEIINIKIKMVNEDCNCRKPWIRKVNTGK